MEEIEIDNIDISTLVYQDPDNMTPIQTKTYVAKLWNCMHNMKNSPELINFRVQAAQKDKDLKKKDKELQNLLEKNAMLDQANKKLVQASKEFVEAREVLKGEVTHLFKKYGSSSPSEFCARKKDPKRRRISQCSSSSTANQQQIVQQQQPVQQLQPLQGQYVQQQQLVQQHQSVPQQQHPVQQHQPVPQQRHPVQGQQPVQQQPVQGHSVQQQQPVQTRAGRGSNGVPTLEQANIAFILSYTFRRLVENDDLNRLMADNPGVGPRVVLKTDAVNLQQVEETGNCDICQMLMNKFNRVQLHGSSMRCCLFCTRVVITEDLTSIGRMELNCDFAFAFEEILSLQDRPYLYGLRPCTSKKQYGIRDFDGYDKLRIVALVYSLRKRYGASVANEAIFGLKSFLKSTHIFNFRFQNSVEQIVELYDSQ